MCGRTTKARRHKSLAETNGHDSHIAPEVAPRNQWPSHVAPEVAPIEVAPADSTPVVAPISAQSVQTPDPPEQAGWLSESISTLTGISFDDISVSALNGISLDEVSISGLSLAEDSTSQPSLRTVFSPMEFRQCPRGPGAPKKKRFGAPSLNESKRKPATDLGQTAENTGATKKKRGRPVGAKNKSKEGPPNKKQKVKKSAYEKALDAAAYELEEIESPNDPESCAICGFNFNDPIKS